MMLGSTASLKQVLQTPATRLKSALPTTRPCTPATEGGVSIGGGSLWALNNNDPVRLAATWRFIEFMISPESQAYWNAQNRLFPGHDRRGRGGGL